MRAKSKPNEIYLERIYDAPVKLVWEAWVDPKQAVQWWGPRGFTFTHISKELKPGGQWKYTMHGPDGTDWPNIATYHEVEEYKRLVYDHGATETTPPLFRTTVNFIELGKNKTKMEMTMALASEEAAKETKKFIKQAGGNSTWDRLAEYLDKKTRDAESFVIAREFEAPLATMWKLWTDPKEFQKWLPPTGFDMQFIRADIRTGGDSFYKMSNKDGVTMYGRASYIEVTPQERLVYTQVFTDEKENVSRHPFAPTWPEKMITHVTFTSETPTVTRVSIRWEVEGNATKEEMQTFIQGRAGMTQGWGGSFEKLEQLLASG